MGRHFDPDDDEHPECPERLVSIESALKEAGLYDRFRLIPPREVRRRRSRLLRSPLTPRSSSIDR